METTISSIPSASCSVELVTMKRVRTKIWVTFAVHGIHKYPDAPEEVAYLRSPHRHLFHIKVSIDVFHDDREIEFHMFQNWLKGQQESGDISFDYKSCEMICADITSRVLSKYDCSHREVEVEVSEDGECGAIVTTTPASLKGN